MICPDCAKAADQPFYSLFCSACGKRCKTYRTGIALSKQSVVVHGVPGVRRMRCPGSKKPPKTGHDMCDQKGGNGCGCQHREGPVSRMQ